MVWQAIGLQILFTAISSVAGAMVLLWSQTKYRRVKLLRGLEQEIDQNLKSVGRAGYRVHDQEDTRAVESLSFNDDIYRTLMAETPVLFSRIMRGFSAIRDSYQGVNRLQNLDSSTVIPNDSREQFLNDLEMLEKRQLQAYLETKEIQRKSRLYQIYNRFWLRESLHMAPGMFAHFSSADEELEETVWRPTGKNTAEVREEILEMSDR